MNIDRVYVALIKEATRRTLNCANGLVLLSKDVGYTLVYAKKNKSKKYDYYDLYTGEKYRKSTGCLVVGDIYIDLLNTIPYRQYLHHYYESNKIDNIKIKNKMFKRKMLTLFNDAQKRGKMEVRNEKNI